MKRPASPVVIGGLLLVLLGGVLWVMRDIEERAPVDSVPKLFVVPPDNWFEFATNQASADPGWVAVPRLVTGGRFRAFQKPEALGLFPPAACVDCHAEIVNTFAETAHARTTTLPTEESILGSFDRPDNRLTTGLADFYFEMVRRDEKFWQTLHVPDGSSSREIQREIALVVGSGNHGQSYLYQSGDRLYQLPVSYFTEFDRWTNAPGPYVDGTADFARPITSRCLECHTTWYAHKPLTINDFDGTDAILGVTCVRCHGPADDHIEFHTLKPDATTAEAIINPAHLDRDRMNEVCAQCHSGGGDLLRPAFSYVPGEPLQEYLDIDLTAAGAHNDDPHSANQLARLMRSQCFQSSEELSCITCHDPHRHERGERELFSSRCLQCHAVDDCGTHPRLGSRIDTRCIECHMPSRRDADVAAAGVEDVLLPLLRDHQIGIWPKVSTQVEQRLSDAVETQDAPRR